MAASYVNRLVDQAMGTSLTLLTRFGGSELVERWGLRSPAGVALREASRQSLKAATAAARTFAPLTRLALPERMRSGAPRPSRFDLRPTADQQMIVDSVRQLADDILRPAARAADAACAPPAEVLDSAWELGLAAMAVPEALGGAGEQRSPITNVLVLEQLARGDMGLALAIAAPLAVIHALVDHGTADQQARYLAPFAEEERLPAAVAFCEPHPAFDPYALRSRAIHTPQGVTVWADKSMVPLASEAEFFLVAADLMGAGPRLFIVPRDADGLTVTADPSMGLRSADLGRLRLDGVKLPADSLLGGRGADFELDDVIARARIAWAAMTVGLGQAMLDYVVPYCNDRVAFGEPISHRQAVAFMAADLAIELDGLRLVTWRAASRAEHGLPFAREAFLAKILAADKGMQFGNDGVQLLGGSGYVTEHPVEMWCRHVRAIGVVEGGLSA